jgi:hypothetical protein
LVYFVQFQGRVFNRTMAKIVGLCAFSRRKEYYNSVNGSDRRKHKLTFGTLPRYQQYGDHGDIYRDQAFTAADATANRNFDVIYLRSSRHVPVQCAVIQTNHSHAFEDTVVCHQVRGRRIWSTMLLLHWYRVPLKDQQFRRGW